MLRAVFSIMAVLAGAGCPETNVGSFIAAGHHATYGQGGNAGEWNDAGISGSYRGLRGSSFNLNCYCLGSSFRGSGYPFEYGV